MNWEFYIMDAILVAFAVGLTAAGYCFFNQWRHGKALRTLQDALAGYGEADKEGRKNQVFLLYPSAKQGAAPGPQEDELLANRLAYLSRSGSHNAAGVAAFSPSDMRELTQARMMGSYSMSILRHLAAILLVMGICGTLWNVSMALQQDGQAAGLLSGDTFRFSLLHSMLAIPFTVLLTALYQICRARQEHFLARLDTATADLLLPLFPQSAAETQATERLLALLKAIPCVNTAGFSNSVRLLGETMQHISGTLEKMAGEYSRRRSYQMAFVSFPTSVWQPGITPATTVSPQAVASANLSEWKRLEETAAAWQPYPESRIPDIRMSLGRIEACDIATTGMDKDTPVGAAAGWQGRGAGIRQGADLLHQASLSQLKDLTQTRKSMLEQEQALLNLADATAGLPQSFAAPPQHSPTPAPES